MLKFIKRIYLLNHGWKQGWTNEDWLLKNKTYSNSDWAGMTTDQAYRYQKQLEKRKNKRKQNDNIR